MQDTPKLKEKYTASKCCNPRQDDAIVGYCSFDDQIKVHRADCTNLAKADQNRLVQLEWKDIIAIVKFTPDNDFHDLDETDFAILGHHLVYGVDYSQKVARMLYIDRQLVFDRHRKLRDMLLLQRVDPLIIRYRKGIVHNKWIKHRNHTYYELTDRGRAYLDFSAD